MGQFVTSGWAYAARAARTAYSAAMSLGPAGERMVRRATHPILFPLWLLVKLPSALFCGLRIIELSPAGCRTRVPYGWRMQNPFRSTYFAVQAMAAEMSTGVLLLLATTDDGGSWSTLIVGLEAAFTKKASEPLVFTCEGGDRVAAALAEAKATGQARTVMLESIGRLPDGTEASRFQFTWSIKRRR